MGNPTIGITGLIVCSTVGSDLRHLLGGLAGGGGSPYSATISVARPEFDTTRFAASLEAMSYTAGINDWTGTVNMRFPNPIAKTGQCGFITYANGYVQDVTDYSVTITAAEHKITGQSPTCLIWDKYRPGLVSYSGSYNAHIDDTDEIPFPLPEGGAIFRLSDEVADNTLAGNILSINSAASVVVTDKNTSSHTFRGNGALTAAGTTPLFPAGVIGTPDIASIVLTADTGRTYAGNCFWTSVTINVPHDGLIDVSVNLRGDGPLVSA